MVHVFDCPDEHNSFLIECNCKQLYRGTIDCCLPPNTQFPFAVLAAATVANPYAAAAAYSQSPINPYVTNPNPLATLTTGLSNLSLNPSTYPGGTYSSASTYPGAGTYYSTAGTYPTAYRDYPVTQTSTTAPAYAPNAHGHPVNISNGIVQTEVRSIHISNLPFGFGEEELKRLITRKVGTMPLSVSLHTDHSTGKSKGSGIAGFSTSEEAQRAVNTLNKFPVKGKYKLKVRLDKNATPISAARTPTIVDSSQTSRYVQHSLERQIMLHAVIQCRGNIGRHGNS
jgi:hypothetical protein